MMKGIFSCRRIRAESNGGSIASLAVSSLWDLQELHYRSACRKCIRPDFFSALSVLFFIQCFSVKKGGINA